MNKEEAREILDRYEGKWNFAQTSISKAFNGIRTQEDDILDERRRLIQKAMRTLAGEEGE